MSSFKQLLGQTSPHPLEIDIERAEGIYIQSTDGKRYIDMISGISVSNLGHRHPKVIEAIEQQISKHLHVMVYGEFVQESQMKLAKSINSITPKSINSSYFVNSGTEANEAALKLAKRATGRSKIVSFRGAYHGSTHGSLSVSGNEYKKYAFRPLLPDVFHIKFGDHEDLQVIDKRTACVIIEPIQGDAGVRIPSTEYMQALRQRCDDMGVLLIVDEIQTGIGRTGSWFAFEHFNIVPDIITMAKGLGGGMPIGAFSCNQDLMNLLTFDPMLGHITTFGGHPVNCAAANACIETIKSEIDFSEVENKGRIIEDKLQHSLVKEIRRKGLFFAIEMENPEIVQQVVENCLKNGLISFWFLSCPNAFRIAPPLNISYEEIEQSCTIITDAMNMVNSH